MPIIEDGIVPADKIAKDGDYDKFELEEAAKTLVKAEEIKADEKLMKALQPLLEKKVKAYRSLEDLRRLASSKRMEEYEADDRNEQKKQERLRS